jgi:hypothetical protein
MKFTGSIAGVMRAQDLFTADERILRPYRLTALRAE